MINRISILIITALIASGMTLGHFVYPTVSTKTDTTSSPNVAASTTATLTVSHSNQQNDNPNNADQSKTSALTSTSGASQSNTSSNNNQISDSSNNSKQGSSAPSSNHSSDTSSSSRPTSQDGSAKSDDRTSPYIDGIGQRSARWWSSETLSTSHINDVIIVPVYCWSYDTDVPTCDSVAPAVSDTAGLHYELHQSYCYTPKGTIYCIREYYAIASKPLHNDNVTASWGRMYVFGVSGGDTKDPFDSNLPATQHCPWSDGASPENYPDGRNAPSCTVNFSPKVSNEFVFEMTMLYDAPVCTANSSATHGWTLIEGNDAWTEVNARDRTNSSNSFTCAFGSDPEIAMVDGIQGQVKDA